jgi:putative ABC transport system permease protein
LLPGLLSQFLPLELSHTITAWPVLKGVAMGLLTTWLFTLWPLLEIREIRPSLVFRRDALEDEPVGPKRAHWKGLAGDRVRILTALALAAGLTGLALWQAGSLTVGLLFISALLTAVIGLALGTRLLLSVLSRLPRPRSLAFRQAIGNLLRPGHQAGGMMLAVGIGVMVVMTVSLLERSLVRHIGENRPTEAPSFFFIDIQPDQKEAFARLLQERTPDARPELIPLVRSRLQAINGQAIDPEAYRSRGEGRDQRPKSWYFTREYVLTFLDHPPKNNTVINGHWWTSDQIGQKPMVSVEEEAARNLGLEPGSMVEFAVQGKTVAAEVTSIRKVDWGNFSTNFYMILSPGSLEDVPFTYVATARVPLAEELPLQRAVVQAFPNVTAINIKDVMENFARILEQLAVAIRAVALFCLLAGGIVMAGALAATRYRRLYESVILKSLGATRGLIAGAFAVEYALVGTVAGLIGTVLATVLSWALLSYVLDLSWAPEPAVWIGGMILTILLTLLVGFFSTFQILRQAPLAILRHE